MLRYRLDDLGWYQFEWLVQPPTAASLDRRATAYLQQVDSVEALEYGNRRVLIVDAATGKYVGHFGAYGQNPVDAENTVIGNAGYEVGLWAADFRKGEMKPKFFRSPLHCAKLSHDGLLSGPFSRQRSCPRSPGGGCNVLMSVSTSAWPVCGRFR